MRLHCLLLSCGLLAALALPARAEFGLLLPDKAIVEEPDQSVTLTIGSIDPFSAVASPLERPQVFTALRRDGETVERSEHLSVLEETTAYGARAWSTSIALPHPGVYQFIMQSKPIWVQDQDHFIQYISKVQVPAFGSSDGWDIKDSVSFEIMPQTRPFGLCSGMGFSGQVLFDDKPIPQARVLVTRLDPSVKIDAAPKQDKAGTPDKASDKKKRTLPELYQVQELKTNQDGSFTFVCPYPGWWVFATSMPGDSLQDPEGKQKPLEIRTMFWVYMEDCLSQKRR